jgi:hypothetical protein
MKFRFFCFCVLALLALSACGEKGPEPGPVGPVPPVNYTVSGTVLLNDGTALAGVMVSDGYACTQTDAQGKYWLDSDLSKRDYIYVSTPSEASAPVVDGIPVFWKFYKDLTKGSDGKYSGVNFTLNKIANPDRYTVFIFADPQPRTRNAGLDKVAYHALDCCNDMYKDMKELRATMMDRPVYGIGLGDIVHQDLSLLPQYKKGMADAGVLTYSVIGNHDQQHILNQSDEEASKAFEAQMGPVNYSFNLGGVHFIVLDDMIAYGPGSGKYSDECATGLTEEIWKWLQNDLSYVPFNTTLMVCAHSPMFHLLGGGERSSATHYADYRSLFSKYEKVYAWAGHTHTTCNFVNLDNPVIETHTLTRVTGPLWTNEYMGSNGTPRGYVVFDCDHGEVSWRFKSIFYQSSDFTGTYPSKYAAPSYEYRDWDYLNGQAILRGDVGKPLDGSYQMQLFAPGTYGDDYLYANIFLWDELWKKPVFYAGGVPASMTRVSDKKFRYSYADADMRKYYREHNSKLAGESSFSEDSNNCESLFRVYVDPKGPKTGTVKVTDRFGNEYSSTISW